MTHKDQLFLESKPAVMEFSTEFHKQYDNLVKYVKRYIIPNVSYKEKSIILGSLEIMKMNSGFIQDVVSRQHVVISNDVLELIWKAIKYHMNSSDSVLKYSPLKIFYIMISIYMVNPDVKLLRSKKFISRFKESSIENMCFTSHNRNVILSLLKLKEESTYWPCIKSYIEKYGK